MIKKGLDENETLACETFVPKEEGLSKQYDKERVLEILRLTLILLRKDPSNIEYQNIHEIRKKLETILLKKSIDHMDSWEEYQKRLSDIDEDSAIRISKALNH
ncbi:MAG: hypothetical protein ACOYWZ_04350 [Bacillota bacterium]